MKKMIMLAGVLLASASFPVMAAGAGSSYFSVGVNLWDIGVDTPIGSGSAEPKGIEGRYGHFMNENFVIEGRLGLGVSDDSGIEIGRNIGVYLKGVANTGGNFQPYAFIGYTDLEIEADSYSETDNDVSYGFGATFGKGSTRFNVEWGRFYSDSVSGIDIDIDSIQLGFVTDF